MDTRERISQTDAVVDQLKRFFLSDRIHEGDKLPTEKMLCETYHVGRSTVREAIRTLQVMGYVEIRPGRGTFLVAKDRSLVDASLAAWIAEHKPGMEETLRVRQALETQAVKFAVEKASDSELSRVDLMRLSFEDAFFRRDFAALPALDEAFHQAIMAASHSDLLITLNNVVSLAFRTWRDRAFKLEELASKAIVPHQRVASALLARDGELAELQMRRHLEQVLGHMIQSQTGGDRLAPRPDPLVPTP
ncbi:MAG: GntR family transcriptional regulator [Planctomycetes bacterium]|nr:GntR family transcriptional regulator [Planctomycetota bacterium]